MVVYLTDELKNDLEALASKRNRSVSNLLETLAKEEVEKAKVAGELSQGDI
jgi:predicted transcriptional regulator